MFQKIYSEMHPISCTNTHHDDTDLVNHGMVKNTKTWISWEQKITFLRNKKILNLCLRSHILRSFHFVAEVTLKLGQAYHWELNWRILSLWIIANNICKGFNKKSRNLSMIKVLTGFWSVLEVLKMVNEVAFINRNDPN